MEEERVDVEEVGAKQEVEAWRTRVKRIEGRRIWRETGEKYRSTIYSAVRRLRETRGYPAK
jgi:hypothetical protein